MSRFEVWLLHISTILTGATGLVYAMMKYLMKPVDPFSVLNHPWEPYMIKAHILAAPLLVFAVGVILRAHVIAKLQSGARAARGHGLGMLAAFGIMTFSGYMLQATVDTAHTAALVVHIASGLLWILFYAAHQVAAYRAVAAQRVVTTEDTVAVP